MQGMNDIAIKWSAPFVATLPFSLSTLMVFSVNIALPALPVEHENAFIVLTTLRVGSF
jgi:hypothetical protein